MKKSIPWVLALVALLVIAASLPKYVGRFYGDGIGLTNVAATNVISGGQLPMGAISASNATAGGIYAVSADGIARQIATGLSVTNGTNLVVSGEIVATARTNTPHAVLTMNASDPLNGPFAIHRGVNDVNAPGKQKDEYLSIGYNLGAPSDTFSLNFESYYQPGVNSVGQSECFFSATAKDGTLVRPIGFNMVHQSNDSTPTHFVYLLANADNYSLASGNGLTQIMSLGNTYGLHFLPFGINLPASTQPRGKLEVNFGSPVSYDQQAMGIVSYYQADNWSWLGPVVLRAGGGTFAAPTAVSTATQTALLIPLFFDGTVWRSGSTVLSQVTSVANNTSVGSELQFWTGTHTASATAAGLDKSGMTNRMTIGTDGKVTIMDTVIATNAFRIIPPDNGGTSTANAPSPLGFFGSMMLSGTTNTVTIGSSGTYYTLTNYGTVRTNGFGANKATGFLTNTVAGYYRITVYASMIGGASDTMEGEVFLNETGREEISLFGSYDNPPRVRTMSSTGILYIPANTGISFRLNNRSDTDNISVWRAAITVGTP